MALEHESVATRERAGGEPAGGAQSTERREQPVVHGKQPYFAGQGQFKLLNKRIRKTQDIFESNGCRI